MPFLDKRVIVLANRGRHVLMLQAFNGELIHDASTLPTDRSLADGHRGIVDLIVDGERMAFVLALDVVLASEKWKWSSR